jgi:ABC-type uncharacterized transport system involved in gliding motility auxiliary subunit
VRVGLDEEIHKLGTTLKVMNIILVPALLAVIALLVVGWRRRQRALHALLQSKGRT